MQSVFDRHILRKDLLFATALLILFIGKLILVSVREIALTGDDDYTYILGSLQSYFLGPYNVFINSRQFSYPLFVSLGRLLGVPLRLWIELAYGFTACLFALSYLGFGLFRLSCLVIFALVLFEPFTFNLFDRVLSDSFYSVALLASLGFLNFGLVGPRAWRTPSRFAAGIALALLWNTRPETVLTLVILATYIAWDLLDQWRGDSELSRNSDSPWKVFLIRSLFIILPFAGVNLFICFLNSQVFGYFASSDLYAPGYQRLSAALDSIAPETRHRFNPVPADVRRRAYLVSPTFALLRHHLEGTVLTTYAPFAKGMTGLDGELGVWFVWALKSAAANSGLAQTGGGLDRTYAQAASEINAALKAGLIPKRRDLFTSFGSPLSEWSLEVPHEMLDYVSLLFRRVDVEQAPDSLSLPEAIRQYNLAALRRTALPGEPKQISSTLLAVSRALSLVNWLGGFVGVATLAAACIACVWHRFHRDRAHGSLFATGALHFAMVALAVVIFARLLLFSAVAAVAFPVTLRYIVPIKPLLDTLFFLSAVALARELPLRRNSGICK